jgi:hypothetical protein
MLIYGKSIRSIVVQIAYPKEMGNQRALNKYVLLPTSTSYFILHTSYLILHTSFHAWTISSACALFLGRYNILRMIPFSSMTNVVRCTPI